MYDGRFAPTSQDCIIHAYDLEAIANRDGRGGFAHFSVAKGIIPV